MQTAQIFKSQTRDAARQGWKISISYLGTYRHLFQSDNNTCPRGHVYEGTRLDISYLYTRQKNLGTRIRNNHVQGSPGPEQ